MKSHIRSSKASGSELAKLKRLRQIGWKPGAGYVSDWLKGSRRSRKPNMMEIVNVAQASQ